MERGSAIIIILGVGGHVQSGSTIKFSKFSIGISICSFSFKLCCISKPISSGMP